MGVTHRDVDKALKKKNSREIEKSLRESNKKKRNIKEKENWAQRLRRKVYELLKGEKAYISEKRYKEMQAARHKKSLKTKRTKQIERSLKRAGLSDKELERFK